MDTRLISRRIKQGLHYLLFSTLLIVAVVIAIDRWISLQTYSTIYTPTDTLPHYDVAVVLGTSKYLGNSSTATTPIGSTLRSTYIIMEH